MLRRYWLSCDIRMICRRTLGITRLINVKSKRLMRPKCQLRKLHYRMRTHRPYRLLYYYVMKKECKTKCRRCFFSIKNNKILYTSEI